MDNKFNSDNRYVNVDEYIRNWFSMMKKLEFKVKI